MGTVYVQEQHKRFVYFQELCSLRCKKWCAQDRKSLKVKYIKDGIVPY